MIMLTIRIIWREFFCFKVAFENIPKLETWIELDPLQYICANAMEVVGGEMHLSPVSFEQGAQLWHNVYNTQCVSVFLLCIHFYNFC